MKLLTRLEKLEAIIKEKTAWRTCPVLQERFKEWDFHEDLMKYDDPLTAICAAINKCVNDYEQEGNKPYESIIEA